MFNFINNKLPPDLSNMFQYSFTVHNYNTRNVSNQGLYIPSINTTAFGIKSLQYNTPVVWNKLLKTNPEISNKRLYIEDCNHCLEYHYILFANQFRFGKNNSTSYGNNRTNKGKY